MMKKKVGLLGGTFNPPHMGHLVIAEQVLEKAQLDEIRFLPNHVPPHKQVDERVTVDQRLWMLEAAIKGHPRFRLNGSNSKGRVPPSHMTPSSF